MPAQDLASELLCLLSPKPAPMAALAADIGYGTAAGIKFLVRELCRRGFKVNVSRYGQFVSVEPDSWPFAREAAERYWRQVHPND